MSVTIRKAANGYIVSYMPEYNKLNAMNVIAHHPQPSDHVFATSEAMLAFVAQKIVDPCIGVPVEQPQTPDPQSSEGESEDEFKTLVDASFSVPVAEVKEALSNGTTHPEQQD